MVERLRIGVAGLAITVLILGVSGCDVMRLPAKTASSTATPSEQPAMVPFLFTEKDDGRTVGVPADEVLTLELREDSIAGDRWQIDGPPPSGLLSMEDVTELPAEWASGTGEGRRVLRFKVNWTSDEELKLKYVLAGGDPAHPARRFSLRVRAL